MTGSDVVAVLRQGTAKSKVIQVSGISFKLHPDKNEEERLTDIMVGNEPIKPDRVYHVGTIDFMFYGGDGLTSFNRAKASMVGNIYSRELFYRGIQEMHNISLEPADKRIIIEGDLK